MEDQTFAPTGTAGDPDLAPVLTSALSRFTAKEREELAAEVAKRRKALEVVHAGEAPPEIARKPKAKPPLEDLDDEEDAEIDDDVVVRMPFAFVRQMACVHLLSSTERRELARGIRASLPPKFVAKLD